MHPITALQMEWSLWTRDIEEEIIPLCRYIQFTDDVFLYILVSWLFPCLRNLRRIHHWHVHQFLMWQCEHFNWEIDCMYPKIKSLHFFLLFFLGIPILLSFLNDCYNKENCPFLCSFDFDILKLSYSEAWVCSLEPWCYCACWELGIGIVPYSPLGRGFFAGKGVVENLAANSILVKFHQYIVSFICWTFKLLA